MNSIETVRLDGMNYTVTTEKPNKLLHGSEGNINYDALEITIKETKPEVWLHTLWHEIMHHISNYRLNNDLSEAQIDAIASGINQALLDNPNLSLEIWNLAETGQFTQESDDPDDDVELELS